MEVVTAALKEEFRYFLEVCHDAPPGATDLPLSVSLRTTKLEFGKSGGRGCSSWEELEGLKGKRMEGRERRRVREGMR